MSNVINYRKKRLNKIVNEFTSKGWDLPTYRGNDLHNLAYNKKSYENYISKVANIRNREKEKIKIKEEIETYRNKLKKKQELETKKVLHSIYGDKTGMYFDKRKDADINIIDIRKGKKHIHNKYSKSMMNMLTEEMTYKDEKGVFHKHGGFFKNTSEEFVVEENLNEIRKLMKEDKNLLGNMTILTTYLYEKIIPLKYEEQTLNGEVIPPEYNSETAKAPLSFFEDTSRKLLKRYKELLR